MKLFVRKLRHGGDLSPDDERVLLDLGGPVQRLDARRDILSEGMQQHSLTLILEGWACRYRDLPDGRRQIISLLLPGDLCEPYVILPQFMDHSLGALTPVSYVRVAVSAITGAASSSAAIENALRWDMLAANAMMHEQAVSLGQRSALERLGHLFSELYLRMRMVGLAHHDGFDLPLTQHDLADALGVSAVHLNRSLQALRATGMIAVRGGRVRIYELDALHDVSLFSPNYFHLRNPVANENSGISPTMPQRGK